MSIKVILEANLEGAIITGIYITTYDKKPTKYRASVTLAIIEARLGIRTDELFE
jgi:hypothetical protein